MICEKRIYSYRRAIAAGEGGLWNFEEKSDDAVQPSITGLHSKCVCVSVFDGDQKGNLIGISVESCIHEAGGRRMGTDDDVDDK